jgi:unsaturated rhamnogalacturonyl hydrolase
MEVGIPTLHIRQRKRPGLRRFALAAIIFLMFAVVFDSQPIGAKEEPVYIQVANSAMARWPEGRFAAAGMPVEWNFQLGALLAGINAVWEKSGDRAYLNYIQSSIDQFVQPDGSIRTYKPEVSSLNDIVFGRRLLMLYRVTKDEKYRKAAMLLRKQLSAQPRTPSGGFWHTRNNPNEMLVDDLFMANPFYAEYASMFHEPQDFPDITKQFVLLDRHARDAKSGLLYHGWDESRTQAGVNKITGTSPNLWARGMGWYMMALVDTLPYYRKDDPGRAVVLGILNRTAKALVRYQDKESGLWYQIVDRPGEKENYIESSSVCMFTYALAKGARLGYLPKQYGASADRAWQGILKRFVQTGADGAPVLTGTVTGVALWGTPANDGSYGYYLHATVTSNDPKGIGPFLMAATEITTTK